MSAQPKVIDLVTFRARAEESARRRRREGLIRKAEQEAKARSRVSISRLMTDEEWIRLHEVTVRPVKGQY